jgi:hypothetical protein
MSGASMRAVVSDGSASSNSLAPATSPSSKARRSSVTGMPTSQASLATSRPGCRSEAPTSRAKNCRSVGYLAAYTSSVATCAASTESDRPTVVMGERPGGSSRRR